MPAVGNRASDEQPLKAASMLGTGELTHTLAANRKNKRAMQRQRNIAMLAAIVGSLFGTALGLWLAGSRPQRGLLTGEWLPR